MKKFMVCLVLFTAIWGSSLTIKTGEATQEDLTKKIPWTIDKVGSIPHEWGTLVSCEIIGSSVLMIFNDRDGNVRMVAFDFNKKVITGTVLKFDRN